MNRGVSQVAFVVWGLIVILAVGVAGFFLGAIVSPPVVIHAPDTVHAAMASSTDQLATSEFATTSATSTLPAEPETWNGLPVYSHDELMRMAFDVYADGIVPLGDGHYTTSAPRKGYLYYCNTPPMGGGAQADGPWIHGSTWNLREKLSVSGSVHWNEARFTDTIAGTERILSGNDLPISHETGDFPIAQSDAVAKYDGNPNAIAAKTLSATLPLEPSYSATPHCMPAGEVGIMLSGVKLFDAMDAEHRDAPAHEAQDSCGGHPQESGQYHYHNLSTCFADTGISTVLGYAYDGFPITGPVVAPGKYLTTDDLDVCHGLVSTITDEKGKTYTTYHYVMTYDFPYSLSCFRGTPTISGPAGPGGRTAPQGAQPPAGGQGGTPPQEAIDACSGKSESAGCSMNTPRGTLTGTCRTPPGQSQLACIPQ